MKKTIFSFTLLFFICCTLVLFAQNKAKKGKMPVLEITLNRKTFSQKDSIYIDLEFTNKMNSTVVLFDVMPERSFDVVILTSKKNKVLLTEKGRSLKNPDIVMHRETLYIEPNKKQKWNKFNLTNLFGELKEGDYTVKVNRYFFQKEQIDKSYSDLFDESKVSIVYSNELKFRVVK